MWVILMKKTNMGSNMQAKLFLANLTVVDHAYIDERGCIIGGSYNPSFVVRGNVTTDENVVVDFGTVKKRIKKAIDDRETGLDHKLHIYSDSSAEVRGNKIITPYLEIEGDENFFVIIDGDYKHLGSAGRAMSALCERELSYIGCKVECINSRTSHFYRPINKKTVVTRPVFFRYVHGLRHSTSSACQNIAHGHLSFVQLMGTVDNDFEELAKTIAHSLNGAIFAWENNVSKNEQGDTIIGYTSLDRGSWKMVIREDIPQPVVILPTETTIEHLVFQIASKMKDRLVDAGVKSILVSEGLSKGSILDVHDL